MQNYSHNDSDLPLIPHPSSTEPVEPPFFPVFCFRIYFRNTNDRAAQSIQTSKDVQPLPQIQEKSSPKICKCLDDGCSGKGLGRPVTGPSVPGRGMGLGGFDKPTTAAQWSRPEKLRPKESSSMLHKESLKIKQSLNKYQDENVKLKTKIQQSGKEIEKKQKIIQGLMEQVKSDSGQISSQYFEAPIIISLKRQLKELKDEHRAKQTELETLKSRLKVNHFKELESELKTNEKECAKLKGIVIDMIRTQSATVPPSDIAMLENRLTQQEAMISKLKEENLGLAGNLQRKEEELLKCKNAAMSYEKKVGKMESAGKDGVKVKKKLIESQREAARLKEEVEALKVDNKDKEVAILKAKINELTKKQHELNDQLKKKNEETQNNKAPSNDVDKKNLEQLKSKISNCM
eukprot:TRINITY_DN1337_c0_g2_i1.p1 TRINITY_DN1337_c0_g2~~TRINITY_DN1337_c0_g2_i1.p1  ORF type:complete len:413 (+),score=107.84 TRINITY_DN1337_c0_g2_i1:30-1241(+)